VATTQGYVQRTTWLTSGWLACFNIGPTPASGEFFFIQMRLADSQDVINFKRSLISFLADAQLSGLEITVAHGDTSAEITAVSTVPANTAATPIQMDALEVTQSIQDLGHSVPLIAGKRTVVRLYLSNYSGAAINVSGAIAIRKSTSDPPSTVNSQNIVTLLPADAGNVLVKRNDVNKSLNFILPASHTVEGPLAISLGTITNTGTSTAVAVGNVRIPIVRFLGSPPLRVRILGMRYTMGTPPMTYAPSTFHINMLLSWLGRAYPVGQVISSVGVADVTAAAPGFGCGDINAQLAALRALDMAAGGDQRTHYYGCVDDGGYWMRGCAAGIPATAASGPTGTGTWGWDFDGSYGDWYGGHELGHTYGRLHPGFCGESADDLTGYPFPAGQIGTDGSFAGFDVGDPTMSLPLAALPGSLWKDVMTYCNQQWISPYTYLGVRRQLVTEDIAAGGSGSGGAGSASSSTGRPDQRYPGAPAPPAAASSPEASTQLVSVVGVVNLTQRQGHLRYVNPLDAGTESDIERESPVILRAKGPRNSILREYPLRVRLNSELMPAEDRIGVVDAAVMLDKTTRSLELLIGGQLADSMAVGGTRPAPQALRVAPKSAGSQLSLALEAETPADNLRYSVQISADGGKTWHTTAVGLTEPRFTIDHSQFKPGDEVQVRVLVTNGLETAIASTETIRL
jgi:hypothetical protein